MVHWTGAPPAWPGLRPAGTWPGISAPPPGCTSILWGIKIIFEILQVREVRLSACCTQTKARPPVALPHCIAARGADMPSDQHRDGNLSMRPRSECCTAPQNLALTSHDPKRSTFLMHPPSAGSGSRLSATGLTVAVMTGIGLSASEDMSGRLTAAQFSAFPGVADWRVLWGAGYAAARFVTGAFAAGVALVAAIGELAGASDRDPDVDVRPQSGPSGCAGRGSGPHQPGRRPGQGDLGRRGPAAGAARPGGRAARAGRDRRPGHRRGPAVLARGARLRRSRRRGPA